MNSFVTVFLLGMRTLFFSVEGKWKRFRKRKNNKKFEPQLETEVQVNIGGYSAGNIFLVLDVLFRIYTTSQKKKCIIYNDSTSSLITN